MNSSHKISHFIFSCHIKSILQSRATQFNYKSLVSSFQQADNDTSVIHWSSLTWSRALAERKVDIKSPSHVLSRAICQQDAGSFPKPWSISVILNTGLQKPKYQSRARTLSTSAKTCPDAGASLLLRGTSEREWMCVCVLESVCVHVATCICRHWWLATESFSTFPVFWQVGVWADQPVESRRMMIFRVLFC